MATAFTLLKDWVEGGINSKRFAVKSGTLVVTSTAAATVAPSVFGLTSIVDSSIMRDGNGAFISTAQDVNGNLVAVDTGAQASGDVAASFSIPVGSYAVTVKGDY